MKTLLRALPVVLALILPGCAGTLGVHEGGFNLISLDQEWEMRDDMKREVAKEYKLVHDRQALAYLDQLGREIVAQTNLAGREWDFGIVQDDSLNAFNLPGGLVYVNTGLIAAAESLDQLVGVMSHEVSHGTARHGTQLMTRQIGYSVLVSLLLGRNAGDMEKVLADLVGTGVLMDYSRDAERESDRLGVGYMYRAGYNPKGMSDFFRKLLEMQKRKPSDVERFFMSHPVTEERIAMVDELRAGLPEKTLIHDTAAFQTFRRRFR